MELHNGDIVRIRQWDDMVVEYGTRDGLYGFDIKTPHVTFFSNLRVLCGRAFEIYNVKAVGDDEKGFQIFRIRDDDGWSLILSEYMVDSVIQSDEIATEYNMDSIQGFLDSLEV